MLDIHTIRLRHPWQCEPCGKGILWLRTFNWPAGLTPRETVRLVIERLPRSAVVRLGTKPLSASPDGSFEITDLLATVNKLAIEIDDSYSADETECPFDVRLEIIEG